MRYRWGLLAALVVGLPAVLPALPFNQLIVFGDSLSDNGNALAVFQNFPQAIPPGAPAPEPPAYSLGRYTSGPDTSPAGTASGLWVDQLASRLGVPDPRPGVPAELFPGVSGGANFAIAGGETGNGLADIGTQVTAYVTTHPGGVNSSALYVLWGGANDIFPSSNPTAAAQTAVSNLTGEIAGLASSGAKYFLWPNLPLLGNTPRGAGSASQLNAATTLFDALWAQAIAQLLAANPGITIVGVNVNALFQAIQANPGAYGFVNTTSPAQGRNVNPDQYVFWDQQHPTAAAHGLIANTAYDDLLSTFAPATATPEPASVALMVFAAGLLVLAYRRRVRAAVARNNARS